MIYCATTPLRAFTPTDGHHLALCVSVTHMGRTSEYHVAFEDVADVRWVPSPYPDVQDDDVFEFSVIDLVREPASWRVWLNPFYVREVSFRCTRIMLDEMPVVGEGRCFQADLPPVSG